MHASCLLLLRKRYCQRGLFWGESVCGGSWRCVCVEEWCCWNDWAFYSASGNLDFFFCLPYFSSLCLSVCLPLFLFFYLYFFLIAYRNTHHLLFYVCSVFLHLYTLLTQCTAASLPDTLTLKSLTSALGIHRSYTYILFYPTPPAFFELDFLVYLMSMPVDVALMSCSCYVHLCNWSGNHFCIFFSSFFTFFSSDIGNFSPQT